MSGLLKTKYVLFDSLNIRTMHDLEVYNQELMNYVKKGYVVRVEVSCTKFDDDGDQVNYNTFKNTRYYSTLPGVQEEDRE